jgi:hydrogenase-4 component F
MNALWILAALPASAGLLAFAVRSDRIRRSLWAGTAILQAILVFRAVVSAGGAKPGAWLALDPLAALFLSVTSLLFLCATFYGIDHIRRKPVTHGVDVEKDWYFMDTSEAFFTGCFLLFFASMTLSVLSWRLGLQWVAIEATTLTSAPLIYTHRNRRSLEAAWKYLLICSVGIALALMGVFFVAVSLPPGVDSLSLEKLLAGAGRLHARWLKMASIFFLVGYGTKMGLAPMHTWLPDAHSEAPSPVSALLSGSLLNCAFLGILRLQQVCVAAGIGAFNQQLFVAFGLLSIGLAGVFVLRQPDYKRLLAYSSVEHMGILALGVGIGGAAAFGSLFHALVHSLVKAALFMLSGNILLSYRSKLAADVKGLRHSLPVTSALWLAGFVAITGSPPFGLFLSEFVILRTALEQGRWGVSAAFLLFLSLVFVGMLGTFLKMSLGPADRPAGKEPLLSILPPLALLVIALGLGLSIPGFLGRLLGEAAVSLGGAGL